MNDRLLDRRNFTRLCATSFLSAGAILAGRSDALAQGAGALQPQDGRSSFAMAPSFQLSARDPRVSAKENTLRRLKKKRYAQVSHSG